MCGEKPDSRPAAEEQRQELACSKHPPLQHRNTQPMLTPTLCLVSIQETTSGATISHKSGEGSLACPRLKPRLSMPLHPQCPLILLFPKNAKTGGGATVASVSGRAHTLNSYTRPVVPTQRNTESFLGVLLVTLLRALLARNGNMG